MMIRGTCAYKAVICGDFLAFRNYSERQQVTGITAILPARCKTHPRPEDVSRNLLAMRRSPQFSQSCFSPPIGPSAGGGT